MTPGDEHVDPLIKRGEELERRIAFSSGMPGRVGDLTEAEQSELASIHVYAATKLRHTTQFPCASTAQEESAQYLAEQEARSAREREAAALRFVTQAWEALRPILLGLARDAITAGVKRLDLPPLLTPVSRVVEDGAQDAVATALDDLGVP